MVGIGFGVTSALGMAGQFASTLMGNAARREQMNSQIRAIEQKRDYTLSLATARSAASGVTLDSGSVSNYLASLAERFDQEIAATRRASSLERNAALVGGFANLLGGAAQGYNSLAMLNKWYTPSSGDVAGGT